MLPIKHIIFSLIFAGVLIFLFPEIGGKGFFLIFFSAILIDVDHYLYYAWKKKDLSLKKAYFWFFNKLEKTFSLEREERNRLPVLFFFLHGIEILFLLFLLSFFSQYFFYIFMGFSFHLLLDSIDQPTLWDRVDKFSLIYDFFKSKKLK